jgi:hypothetical protein
MCTTGVVDTYGKWKKSSIRKVFNILFGHLWVVQLTYRYIFFFKFTLRYKQSDIVPIICHRFSTCIKDTSSTGRKSTAVVIDTSGKVTTGVVDTGGAPKFEMTVMLFLGAWGR